MCTPDPSNEVQQPGLSKARRIGGPLGTAGRLPMPRQGTAGGWKVPVVMNCGVADRFCLLSGLAAADVEVELVAGAVIATRAVEGLF